MSLHQEKMEELRNDLLLEYKLRDDYDYFIDLMISRYGDTILAIKAECEMYGHDFNDVIKILEEN